MGANNQGVDLAGERWTVIPRTLCLILHGNDVLLLRRGPKRRVFPNKYNGVGGHIERGEDPTSSAIREISEETGLQIHKVAFRGVVHIDDGGEAGIMLFVYVAQARHRHFRDSEEGTLEWVPIDMLHTKELVDDFPYLIPYLFGPQHAQVPFSAHKSYDENDQIQFHAFGSNTSG